MNALTEYLFYIYTPFAQRRVDIFDHRLFSASSERHWQSGVKEIGSFQSARGIQTDDLSIVSRMVYLLSHRASKQVETSKNCYSPPILA